MAIPTEATILADLSFALNATKIHQGSEIKQKSGKTKLSKLPTTPKIAAPIPGTYGFGGIEGWGLVGIYTAERHLGQRSPTKSLSDPTKPQFWHLIPASRALQ
jgi:hypothetical protein